MCDQTVSILGAETRLMRLRNWRRRVADIIYDARNRRDCSTPELCKSCLRKIRYLVDALEKEGQSREVVENHLD